MKKLKSDLSGKKRAQERPLHQVERALRARFRLSVQRLQFARTASIELLRGSTGRPRLFAAGGLHNVHARQPTPALRATPPRRGFSESEHGRTMSIPPDHDNSVSPRAFAVVECMGIGLPPEGTLLRSDR